MWTWILGGHHSIHYKGHWIPLGGRNTVAFLTREMVFRCCGLSRWHSQPSSSHGLSRQLGRWEEAEDVSRQGSLCPRKRGEEAEVVSSRKRFLELNSFLKFNRGVLRCGCYSPNLWHICPFWNPFVSSVALILLSPSHETCVQWVNFAVILLLLASHLPLTSFFILVFSTLLHFILSFSCLFHPWSKSITFTKLHRSLRA